MLTLILSLTLTLTQTQTLTLILTLTLTRWPEYLSVLSQRELDLADCFGIKAAETGLDALHHSLWWNISQNVGRTDVLPRPGITGCITPGGEPFGPHRGRCILGYEKVRLRVRATRRSGLGLGLREG